MKVFISWSGDRSKYIAETLKDWLPEVLQALDPWISSDIKKGKRGSLELARELQDTKVGIICLTDDNLTNNWIHFEAGAIAKESNAYLCTFLFGITHTDVKPPLSDFQHTKYDKEDIRKLLHDINNEVERVKEKALPESTLNRVFEKSWTYLQEKLDKTPANKDSPKPVRDQRDLLEEILGIVRATNPGYSFHKGFGFRPSLDYVTPLDIPFVYTIDLFLSKSRGLIKTSEFITIKQVIETNQGRAGTFTVDREGIKVSVTCSDIRPIEHALTIMGYNVKTIEN